MKLIDKLANESNPYDDIMHYEESGVWPEAFEAGFRQAREMAIKFLYSKCTEIGCACKHAYYLDTLGEKEVSV